MTVDLRLGDCLEMMCALPDASVDAVITDPPYCSGGFNESQKKLSNGHGLRSDTRKEIGWFTNDNMGTSGAVWLLRSVAVAANRVMRDGGSLCLFTDWRMIPIIEPALESSGLRWYNLVVWDKGGGGLGWGFRMQHELILHFTKGKFKAYDHSVGNVISVPRMNHNGRLHQTQKPTDLLKSIVKVVSPKSGTVLDPFMGSGTTGVACVKLNRDFIGMEINPDYFAIAEKRIAEAQLQMRLL